MTSFLQSLLVFMPAHPPSPFLEHISALHERIRLGIELGLKGFGKGVSRFRREGREVERGSGFVDVEEGEDIGSGLIRVSCDEII